MAKKDSNVSIKTEKTASGGRATIENKKTGRGVYVEAGGSAPSRINPKGEKRVGGEYQYALADRRKTRRDRVPRAQP